MPLRDAQIERYSRQIILPQIGGRGQQCLLGSAVALVGGGPLIAPAALYLVAAGVGRLDLHAPEADNPALLCEDLRDLNPDTEIAVMRTMQLDHEADWAGAYKVLAAANCDLALLEHLNAAAVGAGVPLVSAQVGPTQGWLAVFAGHQPEAPCALCNQAEIPVAWGGSKTHALTPAVAGVVGSLQALAILRLCLPGGIRSVGSSTRYDGERSVAETRRLEKHPGCASCGESRDEA